MTTTKTTVAAAHLDRDVGIECVSGCRNKPMCIGSPPVDGTSGVESMAADAIVATNRTHLCPYPVREPPHEVVE
jgi:hypothetical protein